MKTSFLTFLIFINLVSSLHSQEKNNISISLDISFTKFNKGSILIALYESKESYMKEIYKSADVLVKDNKAQFTFHSLKEGVYAFSFFHDLNNNKKFLLLLPMKITTDDIITFLLRKKDNIKQPYFFSNNSEYLTTKIPHFRRLMLILVMELQIIKPDLLQDVSGKNNNTERKKIMRLERAIVLGLEELSCSHSFYFKGDVQVPELLGNYFYITKRSFSYFIKDLIFPLLNMVNSTFDYDLIKMERKQGFWRELNEDETMPIGGEISMNLSTGVKMIRM